MQTIIKNNYIFTICLLYSGAASRAFQVLLNSYNNPSVIGTIRGVTIVTPILQSKETSHKKVK